MTSTLNRPPVENSSPGTPRTTAKAPISLKHRLSAFDYKASPYFYVAPFFILFAIVGLFPLIYTFVVSLYDWHTLKGQGDFVGLANFTAVLGDRYFWNSLFNTVSIFFLSTIPQLIAAVVIAAVLDQNLRAKTFWRMSILLPYVVTPVAVAMIFSNVFGENYGLINNILVNFGIDPIMWQNETLPSHIAIATMVNWRWTGYNALILLAAMQSVPRDIHESAALDGAGATRRFFSITLPSIRPTMIFVIITATIGGLQIFTEPRLFDPVTAGGSQRQFQTTVLYLWEMAFFRQNFGKASAIAWLLFLLIVIFGLINFLLSRSIATAEGRGAQARSQRRLLKMRQRQARDTVGAGTAASVLAETVPVPGPADSTEPSESTEERSTR